MAETVQTVEPPQAGKNVRTRSGGTVLSQVAASAVICLPAIILLILAFFVRRNRPLYGDVGILRFIHTFSSPVMNKLALLATTLGSAPVVIAAVLVSAGTLWFYRRRRAAIFLLSSIAGTAVINVVLKDIFHRTRPFLWPRIINETDYSFPSGHAMISSALVFAFIVLFWRTRYRWAIVIGGSIYMLAVALSRLYFDVHYPSDILGGWCASLAWIAAMRLLFSRYVRRRSQQMDKTEVSK